MQNKYKNYIESLKEKTKLNLPERRILDRSTRIEELEDVMLNLNNIKDQVIIKKEIYRQNIELISMIEKWLRINKAS
ncbi:MAG: hypothetical protein ACOC1K_02645 [Nanoarchaeota archaeon]